METRCGLQPDRHSASPAVYALGEGLIGVPLKAKAIARQGKKIDDAAFESLVGKTVDEVVGRQVEIGIDVVSDGEVSKPGFVNYISERLAGFGGVGAPWGLDDTDEVPELITAQYGGAAGQHIMMPERPRICPCGQHAGPYSLKVRIALLCAELTTRREQKVRPGSACPGPCARIEGGRLC